MKTSTISVAIAVYNEENSLGRCLDSVSDWVDEIVLVDGQSSDNTLKIAKKYKNINIISATNKPIFHFNKQIAIDACKMDWILQLDADELVSPELKREIQLILRKPTNLIPENGFWLNRSNFFIGRFLKKGGQYPDPTLRFYKRGKAKLPCLSVHEQAVVEGMVGHLTHDLLHFADISFERYLTRNNRYTSLMARELEEAKLQINPATCINYLLIKPVITFLKIYFRHFGLLDGFPGLVFAYYSAISFQTAFIKYYGQKHPIKR